jgi:hypothetical protein
VSEPLLELRDVHVEFPQRRGWFAKAAPRCVRSRVFRSRSNAAPHSAWSANRAAARARSLASQSDCRRRAPAPCALGRELVSIPRLERRAQIVFQDPYGSLDPRRTVGESLVEPLEIRGALRPRERKLRALAALDACGLDALAFHRLSARALRRPAPARRDRARARSEPQLLVCDEPTSALDVSVRAQIVNLLVRAARALRARAARDLARPRRRPQRVRARGRDVPRPRGRVRAGAKSCSQPRATPTRRLSSPRFRRRSARGRSTRRTAGRAALARTAALRLRLSTRAAPSESASAASAARANGPTWRASASRRSPATSIPPAITCRPISRPSV